MNTVINEWNNPGGMLHVREYEYSRLLNVVNLFHNGILTFFRRLESDSNHFIHGKIDIY